MGDEDEVCEVNMVDSVVHKYLDNVLHDNPLHHVGKPELG